MYGYFNKIITLELINNSCENYESHGFYTSLLEVKIDEINKLIKYSADSPDYRLHTEFIQSYKTIFQNHINYVKSVMKSMEYQSNELIGVLNGSEGVEGLNSTIQLGYFWNVIYDTLYFYKPLEFDEYLKLQSFLIIEMEDTPSGYKVKHHSLGFTTLNNNEILNEPSLLKKQIEMFSTIDNIDNIYSHREYCGNLLIKIFGVRKLNDLFRLENSAAVKLLGTPKEFLREISRTSIFMIIKMSLPQRLKDSFNSEIQELIEVEYQINSRESYKEILGESYTKYCKDLFSEKTILMNSLAFHQNQLEEYMSCLPKDLNI